MLKRLGIALGLSLVLAGLWCWTANAQIYPELPPRTILGNPNFGPNPGPPQPIEFPLLTGQLLSAMTGDCTVDNNGVITCTKTNGSAFGTFATFNYATPPAIGGTTPNSGTFLSLKDTGITGSSQCVQADSSGNFSGTGVTCAGLPPAGQLPGTATNDNASAGNVGEYGSASVAIASPTSLSSGTPLNLASVTLQPGDYDLWGAVQFTGNSATTVTYLIGSIQTANNAVTSALAASCYAVAFLGSSVTVFGTVTGNEGPTAILPCTRVSLATPTTYYLNAQAAFGTNTAAAGGIIQWRRRR